MSRKKIEEEYGISRRTVEQIETGRPISVISLYRYASCFGLEPSDVVFRDSEISQLGSNDIGFANKVVKKCGQVDSDSDLG